MLLLVFSRKNFITTIFVKTFHTSLLSNIVAIITATGQYKCHYIFFSTPSTLENIQYTKCAGRWGSHETKHNTRLQSECNKGSFVPKQAEKFQCNPVSLKWKVQMEWMDGWCPDVRSLAIQLDSGLCSVQCTYTQYLVRFNSVKKKNSNPSQLVFGSSRKDYRVQ